MIYFRVTVNILGHLKDLYPHLDAQTVIELGQPATIAVIVEQLGISTKMVLFATIDDRIVDKKRLIDQPCEINLISPPAGG